jgi:hypothetical protein
MWILKGTLLALWLFGFGTMAWLYFALYRHLRPNSAVSISMTLRRDAGATEPGDTLGHRASLRPSDGTGN